MKLPKTIKIGGHNYRVIQTNLRGDCGETDRTKGTISISENLIQTEKESTLLHEIIHIINNEFAETIVEATAQQLYQVLKDNKLSF